MIRQPIVTAAIIILGFAIALVMVMRPKPSVAPTTNDAAKVNPSAAGNINVSPTAFTTDDLPDRDPAFDFSAALPAAWVAAYVSSSRAINFYDPRAAGQSLRDESQVFVTYTQSTDFQQPAGTVINQEDVTISGYPGRRYMLANQRSVGNADGQPVWLADQHRQVDLRPSAAASRYYSFAQSPDVSNAVFDQFLRSVRFGSSL